MANVDRWAVLAHMPDGDMGGAIAIGSMAEDRAVEKALQIDRAAKRAGVYVETIVIPLESGSSSSRGIVEWLRRRS